MDDYAGDAGGRYGRRVLLYSHDTFGLGHLRRSRTIASAMAAADPDLSALITTGSPIAGRFERRARLAAMTVASTMNSAPSRTGSFCRSTIQGQAAPASSASDRAGQTTFGPAAAAKE